MYEVTWIETGHVELMTYHQAAERFGTMEFEEMLDGNLPHMVVINLDDFDGDDLMTDAEADADTLASAGYGTDEDYGYFGEDSIL